MENRDLYLSIEKIAKEARRSGQAKSRQSHLFVSQMLFIILGAIAIDGEENLLEAMRKSYTAIFDDFIKKEV